MQCEYFDTHRCRSCSLMGTEYGNQITNKQSACVEVLAEVVAPQAWQQPFLSTPERFRNKAKLAIGGSRQHPSVGILDRDLRGVDLRHCGLYEPGLGRAVQAVPDLIADLGLVPYDAAARTGELKHVIMTSSRTGGLMVRFVLRSLGQQGRISRSLDLVHERLPELTVLSVNVQPAPAAVLEGPYDTLLTQQAALPMQVNDVSLLLRPGSFFQTNTDVAAGLYRQARAWIDEIDPESLWDLYCGVGGFALHASCRPGGAAPRRVLGVEVSPEAVQSGRDGASAMGVSDTVQFQVGDATAMLQHLDNPELVVVNPPRRGIGPDLAGRLGASDVQHVLYSSCNIESLRRDLQAMPSLRVRRARLFDMFPQTRHGEVLVLLERVGSAGSGDRAG